MAVLLILIGFVCCYLLVSHYRAHDPLTSFTGAALLMSLSVLFSGELLSLLNRFNYQSLVVYWVLLDLLLIIFLWRKRLSIDKAIAAGYRLIKTHRLACIFLLLFFLAVLLQGLIYPPNNWDSMTYHMARIPHWVANQNLNSFPTHIYRQLFQPPLAELWLAQVSILSRSDLFANSVQLFFLLGTVSAALLIARALDFGVKAKSLLVLLICCTPEIALQASSTQNDLVEAFFVVCSLLFAIRSWRSMQLSHFLLLALSAALACNTKGTAYIYEFPILLIWGLLVLIRMIKERRLQLLPRFVMMAVVFLLINLGYYLRNMQVSGDPLGKNEDGYFMESFAPAQLFLGVAKNAGLHAGLFPMNELANKAVHGLEKMLHEAPDNPAVNFNGTVFRDFRWMHNEDNAANLPQALMVLIVLVSLLFRRRWPNKKALYLFYLVLFEFVLYSVLLKWSPWNSRAQLPLFCLLAVPLAYFFGEMALLSIRLRTWIPALLVLYLLPVLVFNPSRPWIGNNPLTYRTSIFDSRFSKYFVNRPELEKEMTVVRAFIRQHPGQTGLVVDRDTWEYALYQDIFSQPLEVVPHLNVTNHSKNAKQKSEPAGIVHIISDQKGEDLLYNGRSYKRRAVYGSMSLFSLVN
jgi:hypothetical protein